MSQQVESGQIERDVVVVGAGVAGLYMLHKLRALGMTAQCFERGDGVGGTWYWNRYPGARCDIESIDYSYSFDADLEQEWQWTERFPAQPELLRYINHVADRFDLRRDVKFSTSVLSAHFDESAGRWLVRTDDGDVVSAQYLVMATGCLSTARIPDFPGLKDFGGDTYHTGYWPHEGVDFTGKRVAVIGTGSSAIQSIPIIAEQADQLTVFQRTANFSMPAHNAPLDPEVEREVKATYPQRREVARMSPGGFAAANRGTKKMAEDDVDSRWQRWEEGWARGGLGSVTGAYIDTIVDADANEQAAEFVRTKIREIVKDSATAELLCPRTYPIGTKRVCVDTNYFQTYNRDNVSLVDVRSDPIANLTSTGLALESGAGYEFDAIVFATGFDAMTGSLLGVDIQGRDGMRLADKWAHGPRAYLGIASAGFPNLFMITGPGSPSVLSNMMTSIEQHVEWTADYLKFLADNGLAQFEADLDAENTWVEHVNEVANRTLYPTAASWYMGANIPGKPRVFMPYVGGVGNYRVHCDDVAARGYEGFVLS